MSLLARGNSGRLLPCISIDVAIVAIVMLPSAGCLPSDCDDLVTLRGTLVDIESGSPAIDAVLGLRSFTEDGETYFVPPLSPSGRINGWVPDGAGRFVSTFGTDLFPCNQPEVFPRPDRIELIVARGGCVQSIFIDINEQTVVDINFPDDVIELRDPALVPPCPAAASP